MTPVSFPALPFPWWLAGLRLWWIVAALDAFGAAVAALLLGPSGIDPAVGFRG